ncbi:MAG: ABC-F family ATP-binding cassette domain-containing protein [Proteobacteria bacterium]|nr:ABC-F family ATP-binding cassette domain-containing protein [Pseudomonadota bacterium]
MQILKLTEIQKRIGNRELFKGIDLTVTSNDKIGLLGPNGAGKSTLLKIIADLMDYDNGEVSTKRNLNVAYLAQAEEFNEEKTLIDCVLESLNPAVPEEEKRPKAILALSKAGFNTQIEETTVKEISGGWKKRLSIACATAQDADLILLDEPTNHLDLDGIVDLENTLKNAEFAFILVSHDRRFLNNVTNKTMEINSIYPKGFYKQNLPYEKFMAKREEYFKNEQSTRDSLKARLKVEQEWLQRGVRGRGTKQDARVGSIHEMKNQLKDLNKRLAIKRSQERSFAFSATDRKTKRLIEIRKITKKYADKTILRHFSLRVAPKTCIGLLGKNGAGKSTLQNIISKRINPDSGSVKYVTGLKVSVFDQARTAVNKKLTPREIFCGSSDSVIFQDRVVHINVWLKYLQLRHDQVDTPIKNLSGGEQARLNLGLIMLEKADVLLLDEPTNDLDIESLRMLEIALKTFSGAIILISHDRKLVESVSTKILGFVGNADLQEFEDIEQWQKFMVSGVKDTVKKPTPQKVEKQDHRNRVQKMSFKDKFELDNMEQTITDLETEIESLESNPVDATNYDAYQEYCDKLGKLHETLERKFIRWDELSKMQAESA